MAFKYILHFVVFKIVLKNFLRLFVGIEFPRTSNFKDFPQCIYVANHNSHMDTAAFLAMLPMKNHLDAHPVAAGDYFGRHPLKQKFYEFVFNTLLIDRKGKQEIAKVIEPIGQALKNKKSILIFPEGSRGEPEVMGQFKNGVSFLLKNHPHIPFVPIFMQGLGKAMPRGDAVIIPHESRIVVGKPIYIPDVANMPVQEITAIIRQSILDLE